jgi:hypothetical protein
MASGGEGNPVARDGAVDSGMVHRVLVHISWLVSEFILESGVFAMEPLYPKSPWKAK